MYTILYVPLCVMFVLLPSMQPRQECDSREDTEHRRLLWSVRGWEVCHPRRAGRTLHEELGCTEREERPADLPQVPCPVCRPDHGTVCICPTQLYCGCSSCNAISDLGFFLSDFWGNENTGNHWNSLLWQCLKWKMAERTCSLMCCQNWMI